MAVFMAVMDIDSSQQEETDRSQPQHNADESSTKTSQRAVKDEADNNGPDSLKETKTDLNDSPSSEMGQMVTEAEIEVASENKRQFNKDTDEADTNGEVKMDQVKRESEYAVERLNCRHLTHKWTKIM